MRHQDFGRSGSAHWQRDKATSALDTETEQLVSAAINALAGSKTLIIIAHRYSTVEKCDRIYELSEGQLKQSFTEANTLAKNLNK